MKKSLIFLVQLFVLISIQNSKLLSQKHELYIEFSIEKTEYIEEEPIIFNYTLTNSGNSKETIFFSGDIFDYTFHLIKLKNEKGDLLGYCGPEWLDIGDHITLHPKDNLSTEKNDIFGYGMNLLFGFGTKKSVFFGGIDRYIPAGIYTLNLNSKMNAINGPVYIHSNDIFFEIKKAGLKEGYNKLFEIFAMPDSSAKFDSLRKYIYEYPESGYLNIAFVEFLRVRGFRTITIQEFIKDFNYFIDMKHDSWSIYYYLKYCSDAINEAKGEDEMINYLVEKMNKYPGTKLSIAAYNLLSKVIPNEIYLKGLKN